QVVVLAGAGPDAGAVTQVDAVDVTGIGGAEDGLAVLDARGGDHPLVLRGDGHQLAVVPHPAGRGGLPAPVGVVLVDRRGLRLLAGGGRPGEGARQPVDARNRTGTPPGDEDALRVGDVA